jgi:two-component system sensor histidine kinase ComP
MLNRVSGKEQREENFAERDGHGRVLKLGVPPGGRPNATGLKAAVNRLIATSQACDSAEIEFWNDLAIDKLSPELQPAVLSIVQELLLNACRHSKSKNVLLGLGQDDGYLCVQVQDWGIGFDPPQPDRPHRRGLKGIRDLVGWLGGTLHIDSQRGKGTCAIVEIPLSKETGPSDPATTPRPR